MEMTLNFQSAARSTVVRVFGYLAVETIMMGNVCRRMATEVARCFTSTGRWKGLPTKPCIVRKIMKMIFITLYVPFIRILRHNISYTTISNDIIAMFRFF